MSGKQVIFDMGVSVTNCPSFTVCTGTNNRPNRVPLDALQQTCFPIMKAPGRTVPQYIKKPISNANKYRLVCKCKNTSCTCMAICDGGCVT